MWICHDISTQKGKQNPRSTLVESNIHGWEITMFGDWSRNVFYAPIFDYDYWIGYVHAYIYIYVYMNMITYMHIYITYIYIHTQIIDIFVTQSMGQMMIEMVPPCPPVPMVALLPTTWPLQKGAGASRRAPKSEPRVWLQMGLGVDVRLGWLWDGVWILLFFNDWMSFLEFHRPFKRGSDLANGRWASVGGPRRLP